MKREGNVLQQQINLQYHFIMCYFWPDLWATTSTFSCYCDLWKIHIHVFVSLSLEVDLCKRGQSFENWKEFCGQSFENWKIEKFWQLENKKVWKIEKSFGGAADKGALSTLSHLRTSANPITINNTLNTTYFQLWTPPALLSKNVLLENWCYFIFRHRQAKLFFLTRFLETLDDRPLLKPSKFKLSWSNFPLQCRPTVTSICFPSGTSWQGKRRQDKKKPYTDLLMFRAWSNSKRSIHHTKSWHQSVVFVWKPSNFLSIIAQNKSLWEPATAILSL